MARPFEDKYSIGSKFVLKVKLLKTFQNKCHKFPNYIEFNQNIFTKVDECESHVKIEFGGDQSKLVYLQNDETNQIFHLIGSSLATYFNKVVDKKGIHWSTSVLETSQCLGFFFDGSKILKAKTQKDIKKHITLIKKIFNKKYDWEEKAKQHILSHIDSLSKSDLLQFANLINGTSIFYKKVSLNIPKPKIIHNLIDTYYQAEEKDINNVIGAKANTADVILTNVTPKTLIKQVATKKVTYTKTGLCKIGKSKFYQVSLKKGKGKAQLGKISSLIISKYNIPSYNNLLALALNNKKKV